MSTQTSLFDAPPVAGVRRSDPSTSKQAAAMTTVIHAEQWKLLLRRMHDGPISADTAGQVIDAHRSVAATRLAVLVRRGLAEHAGKHAEAPTEGGREREVLRWRLTEAGEREYALLFGGVA